MAIVNGVVDNVSEKFGKYSVQVNGQWYGTKAEWAKVKPVAGDEVSFDDGGGKFTKNMKIVTAGGGAPAANTGGTVKSTFTPNKGRTFPVAPDAPERTINRQNALTNATNLVMSMEKLPAKKDQVDLIIEIAEKMEAYTTGDLDMQRAQATLQGSVTEE